MNKQKINLLILFFLIVLIILPYFFNGYYIRLINIDGIYVLLTLGLLIVTGFTGQISFAQAAFFGIGAYTSALFSIHTGLPFLLCLLLGGIVAAFFGLILGFPTLRLKGHYLAVVTIGFTIIIRIILLNSTSVTSGAEGLKNIPYPIIFGIKINTEIRYYYLILILCILSIIFVYRIKNSRIGRALITIKQDDLLANILGINSFYYKMLAFALSGFLGGIAGSLFAHYEGYLHPGSFTFLESCKILVMLFIGGSTSVPGAIIGASLVSILPEVLRFLKDYYMAVYALALIFMMIFVPDGIVSLFNRRKINND